MGKDYKRVSLAFDLNEPLQLEAFLFLSALDRKKTEYLSAIIHNNLKNYNIDLSKIDKDLKKNIIFNAINQIDVRYESRTSINSTSNISVKKTIPTKINPKPIPKPDVFDDVDDMDELKIEAITETVTENIISESNNDSDDSISLVSDFQSMLGDFL